MLRRYRLQRLKANRARTVRARDGARYLGFSGRSNRNDGLQKCSFAAGFDLQSATQLLNAFAHAGQADSHVSSVLLEAIQGILRDALSVVLNGQGHATCISSQPYLDRLATGVAMNVGERLLQNAEERGLDFRWKSVESFWNLERSPDSTALAETLHIPARGRNEPCFIE